MKAKYLNTDIREAIKKSGLNNYEVASALGIATTTFASWLQTELKQDRKERILNAIQDYKGKKGIYLNLDVKEAMKKKGLANYEVANARGIRPGTFAHWLQRDLSQEQKERVFAAIDSINE